MARDASSLAAGLKPGIAMAALTLLLRHQMTGCPLAAGQAACLLDRLTGCAGLDQETRDLFDRISERLVDRARSF